MIQNLLLTLSPEESSELLSVFRSCRDLLIEYKKKTGESTPVFVDDLTARIRLGGGRKPIAKKTFNSLRKEGKITTYYSSPGRTAYKVAEIDELISNHKSDNNTKPNL